MSKTFKLVAWLVLCLPMSSAFAQWTYRPVLAENAGSSGAQWVLDVSMEVTADAGEAVWLNTLEMAVAFSSSDPSGSGAELSSAEVGAFVGGAGLSTFTNSPDPDDALELKRADTTDGTEIALVWAQASGPPGLTCTVGASASTCTIPLVTITVPAGPAVGADVVSATVVNLETGAVGGPGTVEVDALAYVAGGSAVVPEEPTVTEAGPLTYTFPDIDLDINGDGERDIKDMTVLYIRSIPSVELVLTDAAAREPILSAHASDPETAWANAATLLGLPSP